MPVLLNPRTLLIISFTIAQELFGFTRNNSSQGYELSRLLFDYRLYRLMICTEAAESLALTDRTNNAAPAVITRTNKQYCMHVKKYNVMHVASNCGYENKNDNYEDKQTAPAVITGTNTQ